MPEEIDSESEVRAMPLVTEHRQEYPSLNAAAAAVANQLGLGRRRCAVALSSLKQIMRVDSANVSSRQLPREAALVIEPVDQGAACPPTPGIRVPVGIDDVLAGDLKRDNVVDSQ